MDLGEKARLFAALSDPLRLRIIEELRMRDLACGKELAQTLEVSGALLSHHAKILEDAGLIQRKKDGQFSRFFLNRDRLEELRRVAHLGVDFPD